MPSRARRSKCAARTLKAKAIAHTITFDDPEKKKRTAIG